ncbi:MAG TPA: hypothetical protein VGP68_12780 [Gemmataceae bacterium]|jgi:hypothetical protein|nr:hypothetical protein [Gemmataceae bacterium]
MRAMLCAAMALGLVGLASGSTRADEQAGLKALIEKAITAHGGKDNIEKYKAVTTKLKGKANAQGMVFDFTMEIMAQDPDKSKVTMDIDIMGQKINVLEIYNGDMGWSKNPITGQIEAFNKEKLAETKEQAYAHRVESLVALLGKEFKLTPLGESKIGENDAIGIRVSSEGHRDVSLYFDKTSNLLLKSETAAKDPMVGDKEFMQESFFSDYKDAQGLKYPTKLTMKRDGMDFINGEITEWVPSEKFEDSVFAKP